MLFVHCHDLVLLQFKPPLTASKTTSALALPRCIDTPRCGMQCSMTCQQLHATCVFGLLCFCLLQASIGRGAQSAVFAAVGAASGKHQLHWADDDGDTDNGHKWVNGSRPSWTQQASCPVCYEA
jgi:hypothetical protein